MDTDELDQWLEVDDADGVGTTPTQGRTTLRKDPQRRRGRPRWLLPAVAAAVLWAGVMVVLATRSGTPVQPATPPASDLLVPSQPTVQAPAAGTVADPLAEDTEPDAGDVAAQGATDLPATQDQQQISDDHETLGPLHGAAVAALRSALTTSGPDGDRYLELATPVALSQLGEGAVIVVLQAIWLEGAEGHLSQVHQGRWAVPLAADGTLLGTPWPAGAEPADSAVPEGPPVGTLRLPEVEAAMTAAGWRDVQAVAAQDHPFISGVLVALVQGTPPSGSPRDGDVVWLEDGPEGLMLLGTDR
ncbi:MAG TPA: hypothetical protein VMM13_07820 [Euzebya sp.]|nr:hypothetical protein [Euzebya sp.]